MILILGSKGMLGGELQKVFADALSWDREEADVTKIGDLKFKIENLKIKPEAIINCVAFNDVDGAEIKPELAFQLNAEAPGNLARLCRELDVPLVHFSTNYVFDGEKGEYAETDIPNPRSAYAKSKYEGELAVAKNCNKYYIFRTAVLFGPPGASELSKKSFVSLMLELSQKTDTIKAVTDEINSITYSADLAQTVKSILEKHLPFGVYHVTNSGFASWYDMAKEIFRIKTVAIDLAPVQSADFPRLAQRPKQSVLLNTKLPPLRSWQEALAEFLNSDKGGPASDGL